MEWRHQSRKIARREPPEKRGKEILRRKQKKPHGAHPRETHRRVTRRRVDKSDSGDSIQPPNPMPSAHHEFKARV
jgi:hypothetical protein